jgi:hypothetical protein
MQREQALYEFTWLTSDLFHCSYWTFFPTFPLEVRRHFEELIAIQWSFSSGTNTLSINRQYEFLLEPGVEGQSGGYVASINATVVTNVNDGVMLPWFNFADAVLLNDGITPKVANLPLQLIRRPTHEKTAIYDIVGACASVTENALLRPLLTITYESNPSSARVPTFAFPSELYSTSPSTTFPIRRAVLSVLAPVALVSVRVVEAGAVVVKLIFYAAIFGGLCIVLLGLLRNWRSERMEIVRQGQREGGGTETKPEVNDADIKMAISNSAEDLV